MPISTSSENKPCIGITLGDPSGIGPEVVMKSLASHKIKGLANFLVIGEHLKSVKMGKVSAACGKAALRSIEKAVELLKEGVIDGLVTAPVNKEAINKAGYKFKGHTEFLAEKTNTKDFVMMLIGGGLRVAVVTRHIPLKKVAPSLNRDNIYKTIKTVDFELSKFFGIRSPRVAVCSLNPHAGEGGIFGNEEEKAIIPAVNKARKQNIKVYGPFPSDSLFRDVYSGRYDVVIAMYHDQGLTPLKMVSKRAGVNVTLGLPFVRTSPDHGTAHDIAGQDKADPSSMREAILLCSSLSLRKKNTYATKCH